MRYGIPLKVLVIKNDMLNQIAWEQIEAVVDPYEPMVPARMPDDYAKNLEKALSETPGQERIKTNLYRQDA